MAHKDSGKAPNFLKILAMEPPAIDAQPNDNHPILGTGMYI